MRMMAESISSLMPMSTSSTCACTVTSRAVVGSSAMSRSGLQVIAMAIIARWRMPPENSCGYMLARLAASGMPDQVEHLDGALLGVLLAEALVDPGHLADLTADGVHRVQGGERVLEDHGDLAAADLAPLLLAHGEEVAGLPQDLALVHLDGGQEAEDRHRGDRLAGARLADDREHLAAVHVEAHAVDGVDDTVVGGELGVEVADREQELAGAGRGQGHFSFGSRASRRPSPMKTKARTVMKIARPGKISMWGATEMTLLPSDTIRPHDGVGYTGPTPEERQRRLGEDHAADGDGAVDDDRLEGVRQDVAEHDAPAASSRGRGWPPRTRAV